MSFVEICEFLVLLVIGLTVLFALIYLVCVPRSSKAEALNLASDPRGNKRRSSGCVRSSSALPPPPPPTHPQPSMSTKTEAVVPPAAASSSASAFRPLRPTAPSTTTIAPLSFTQADYADATGERLGTPPTSPTILRLGEEGKASPINVHAGTENLKGDMGYVDRSITGKPLQSVIHHGAHILTQPAYLSLTIDDGKATLKGSGIGVADFLVEEKACAVDVVLTMTFKRGVLALLAMMAFLLPSCTIGISPTGDKNVSVDGVQLYSVVKSVLADRAAKAAAERDAKAAKNVQPEG